MESTKTPTGTKSWGSFSLLLSIASLLLFTAYGVQTSKAISAIARVEAVPKVCWYSAGGDLKGTADIAAIMAMVLSLVALKAGPRWLGRVAFLMAFLACCTIPFVI